MKTYFIGGSPCSGKSTVASLLSQKYGLHYFVLDEKLEAYMKRAASEGKPRCTAYFRITPDQVWMRPPQIQFEDEVGIYNEIFEYALEDMNKLYSLRPIITEGAGYLPELVKQAGIGSDDYISMTPTRDFQISLYSRREWVPYILQGCTDKKKAFENWMDRDVLFAEYVDRTAVELGYQAFKTDGSISPETMLHKVEEAFSL